MNALPKKKLKELLHYDPLTGIFTWRERPINMFKPGKYQIRACNIWNARFANKEAGSIWTDKRHKTSYLKIGISLNGEKERYLAHRLAILYTDGHFPAEQVDHIDGNGLNNKWGNLRKVTSQENNKNKPMRSDNTSGKVGVKWYEPTQKWQVQININGKRIHGGCFINKEEAIKKRKQMEIEYGFHANHGRSMENM